MKWKDRLLEEIVDLKGKIEKLADFKYSDKFDDLDSKNQMLLDMQLNAMMMYLDVLVLRAEYTGLSGDLIAIFES